MVKFYKVTPEDIRTNNKKWYLSNYCGIYKTNGFRNF